VRSAGLITLSLVALISGCAKGTSEFSHSKERDKLTPGAEKFVDSYVDSRFGTPTRIRVWDKLGLDSNKAVGSVESATENQVDLKFQETVFSVKPGDQIVFPGAKPLIGEIKSFDDKTQVAVFTKPLDAAPASGSGALIGAGEVIAEGRMLYAEHCLHCHGVTGDGNGPTAKYLSPKPRDYRRGLFKFTSTHYDYRPRRDDLARILSDGIPGTYMPSFKLLTPEESAAIVEYVIFLTMRGQLEDGLAKYLNADFSEEAAADALKDGKGPSEMEESLKKEVESAEFGPDTVDPIVEGIVSNWKASQTDEPTTRVFVKSEGIAPSAESIARGRQIYLSENAGCSKCHGQAGRGDGPSTTSLNSEGTLGLVDAWGNSIQPRNLRGGIYRGGRRPYDIYCRISVGIKGTPMPGIPEAKMSEEDRWHLVNYVLSMPFDELVPGAGAKEVVEQPKVADAAKSSRVSGQ
jgi:mono/diheme cytochrome c family protein